MTAAITAAINLCMALCSFISAPARSVRDYHGRAAEFVFNDGFFSRYDVDDKLPSRIVPGHATRDRVHPGGDVRALERRLIREQLSVDPQLAHPAEEIGRQQSGRNDDDGRGLCAFLGSRRTRVLPGR